MFVMIYFWVIRIHNSLVNQLCPLKHTKRFVKSNTSQIEYFIFKKKTPLKPNQIVIRERAQDEGGSRTKFPGAFTTRSFLRILRDKRKTPKMGGIRIWL